MADAAFRAMLALCQFNDATQTFVMERGVGSMEDLQQIDLDGIETMMKQLTRERPTPAARQQAVTFPYVSTRRLMAVRLWQEYKTLRGEVAPAGDVTREIIQTFMGRMDDLAAFKQEESSEKEKPPELTTLAKWVTWDELLCTYIRKHRSADAGVPMTYVIRKEADVTPEALAFTYLSIDDDLIETRRLNGQGYIRDNNRLYDMLKPPVINGPGWPYIQPYNRTRDGRAAYLALKRNAERKVVTLTRKQRAYNDISASV